MTARQPPGPPPLPNFDSYRPIEERAGEPRPPSRGASQSQRRRPVPKKQMGWLSWVLIGVLGFLGLAVGAGAVFILSLPKDFVRDEIVAQVNAKTGRELTIAGPASFRLYPSIGFSLADVSLSAPAGMAGKPLVQMASLDVSVRLLPLLKREVAIERLVLKKPVFELYADKDGRKSWDLASLAGPWRGTAPPVRLAQAGGGTASDAQGGMPKDAVAGAQSAGKTAALEQLELGDVRIEDGTVRYADARSGARQEASQIDVRLGLKSISQPLSAAGSLVWKAEKIDFDGKLTSVKSILEERPAKLVLTIASKPVSGSYDGTFIVKDAIDAEGSVAAKSESLKFLAKWLGTELPAVAGFGPLDIKGQFRAAGKVVSFANASISLDGATATGQITVDTAPTRPYLKGNLKLSELNLNKYIGNESYSTASEPVTASEPAPNLSPEKSIDELLSEPASSPPGPKVKGYTQRAGWSEGQIDASALGLADADFKLSVGRLLFKEIKVGRSDLTVALKSNVMKTTFDEVQLYDGKGRGFITLDATAPKIAGIAANITLDGVAAQGLLKDAADMDWLAGKGKLVLAVSGQGQNQRQIVETLTGKADLIFTNGAIVGWNIAGMVRGLSQGKLAGLNRTPAEKTDFSEFASTWTITNGIAQNQDLRLVSPLLRVAGAGSVSLPAREVDYMVRPTLVASLAGQGAADKPSGLEIPVRVHGSWDKPNITPDIAGVLKDPNQAVETVKQIGKQFKGKSANDIVKGLLGESGGAEATPNDAAGSPPKSKKLLDQLFKQ